MNIFTKALNTLTGMRWPRATDWRGAYAPRTRFDYAKEIGDGDRSSIIMATLNWITRNFPEAPLMIQERTANGEMEARPDHSVVKLLKWPNPYHSGHLLWMGILLSWTLDGNAYVVKLRSATSAPVQLVYIPHGLIEPKWPTDGSQFIDHYEYRPGGGMPIRYEPSDVIHFRYGMDPDNTRKGLSPLKSLVREVFSDLEAANFTASLLRNMGVPGIVVSPKERQTVAADDVSATKAFFATKFTGDHRGEPLIMSGPTELAQFGFSPEQLNLRALRQIPEERITAVLGIPAAVVGLGTGLEQTKVGATMAELREQAYENNIIPTQRLMASELHLQLLPDFESDPERFEVSFDHSKVQVLQDDKNKESERWARLLSAGAVTRAEVRAAFNLPIRPRDEVYHLPVSFIEVPAGQVPSSAGRVATSALPVYDRPQITSFKATDAERRLMLAFRRDVEHISAAFSGALVRDFQDLGSKAAEAFSRVPALVTRATNGRGGKQDPDDGLLVEEVMNAVDINGWQQDTLASTFAINYERMIEATLSSINSVLDLGVDLPDFAAREIVEAGGRRVGLMDVQGQTRQALFRALSEGRAAGEGPPALAQRIRDQVPAGRFGNAGVRYRAEMIARTETKYAQNVSTIHAYRHSEVVTGLQAFDNQSGFDDEDCAARDGTIFGFDEADAETAREHPNGTLSWAPVVRE